MTTTDPALPESRVRPPVPPPPRWAVCAAHVVAWSTVPSGLWRVALVLGVPVGVMEREEFLAAFPDNSPVIGLAYVLLIGAVAEAASYLTLGLVRPWGEVVPRWIPFLGGRARTPASRPAKPSSWPPTPHSCCGARSWLP